MRIGELIDATIAQAAARRPATGIEPLGPAAILRQHPFSEPAKTKKSPAPLVHAASKRVRTEMKIAKDLAAAGDRLRRRIGAGLKWKHGFGMAAVSCFFVRTGPHALPANHR